jgi:hypothetical protein
MDELFSKTGVFKTVILKRVGCFQKMHGRHSTSSGWPIGESAIQQAESLRLLCLADAEV